MMDRFIVKLDLPLLESALSGIQSNFVEHFDGMWFVGVNIDRCIDHPIDSYSKNPSELQPVGNDKAQSVLWSSYAAE